MPVRRKGRMITPGSFPIICKVHSLPALVMLDKELTSSDSRRSPPTATWSHSKIPQERYRALTTMGKALTIRTCIGCSGS